MTFKRIKLSLTVELKVHLGEISGMCVSDLTPKHGALFCLHKKDPFEVLPKKD